MNPNARILRAWLETKAWYANPGKKVDIPENVLSELKPFLVAKSATEEEQDVYRQTLSTLFNNYRKSSYENRELLGEALIKLGAFSKTAFWQPAVDFLNMAPGIGDTAISTWVTTLGLDAEETQALKTELFHAYR